MSAVSKGYYKDREILIVDYSNGKESEMIKIVSEAKKIIETENKPVLILSILNEKNFATPKFMRHVEKEMKEMEHLVERHAALGLNTIKIMILRGMNLWLKKEIKHFKTKEEAFEFLVNAEGKSNSH